MQHEVTKKQPLLNKEGIIAEPGYAKTMVWQYNRAGIKTAKALIKEWDYYYIGNDYYALCLTIADMGYIGALSATVIDFKKPWQITKSSLVLFPMGKIKMPASSDSGDVSYKNGAVEMTFLNDGKKRRLYGVYPAFGDNKENLTFDVTLTDTPPESMVIATPFTKKGRFYYNQKINCMRANGAFSMGDTQYTFDGKTAMASLDWGRGVWTYDNTWYWGSLQTELADGSTFGFNIGYGFGDTSAASENMLFYNGKAHKLDEIVFNIPVDAQGKDDFMSPWTFTSNDKRLELDFTPVIDRYAPADFKVFSMIPHQVFGKISGKAILDDGKEIILKDVLGFAEKVHNKW
ncbi:MAG: DUF2804 domain-containing protein [Clostridia bacterium]|nr:DUF2804 domain-containing protein [Clostridia bacterium]